MAPQCIVGGPVSALPRLRGRAGWGRAIVRQAGGAIIRHRFRPATARETAAACSAGCAVAPELGGAARRLFWPGEVLKNNAGFRRPAHALGVAVRDELL